ncbi:MAG: hypothetical protein E7415_04870 [Ruminococcaceae bacterium]|nr:hypothetical protein [Oscillospiraceae bacterium]
MKLLTINTHSLLEENYEEKCNIFVEAIAKIKPDVIAMQEVNQRVDSEIASSPEVFGFKGEMKIPVKSDNHALKISKMLEKCGEHYFFCWEGIKCGYGKYDEGIAIFSRKPIEMAESYYLTTCKEYDNFKTRKALAISSCDKVFVSVHTGWYEDEEEPFSIQLGALNKALKPYLDKEVYLMGDFNVPSHREDGGYPEILKSGWYDTYNMALDKDGGYTVEGKIDGWLYESERKRIDYIFVNKEIDVKSSRVIFNDHNEKRISDHNGILVEI